MDYHKLKALTLVLLSSFVIVACNGDSSPFQTKVDPDPLQIIGVPSNKMYYDTVFEEEIGVSGGDGTYQLTYIKNPEIDDEEDLETNFIDVDIEKVTGGFKPSFILRATPEIPEGTDFDELGPRVMKYQLRLTDGKQSVTRDFEFTLDRKQLKVAGGEVTAIEGSAVTTPVDGLRDALPNPVVCEQDVLRDYSPRVHESGATIYPVTTEVRIDLPAEQPTQFSFELSSEYDETLPERHVRNIGKARPGVDYVVGTKEENTVVLEPGVTNCIFTVYVFDDPVVEGVEEFEVTFVDSEGAKLDLDAAKRTIRIVDNEPGVFWSPVTKTVNEGDTFASQVQMSVPGANPISVRVTVDETASTVSSDDYRFIPEDGVITFEPGETTKAFSVIFEQNDDGDNDGRDEKLVLTLDTNEINEEDNSEFTINEWLADNEIITTSTETRVPVSFSIDSDSDLFVAYSDQSGLFERAYVKGFSYNGDAYMLTSGSESIEVSQDGVNVSPVEVFTSNTVLVLVAQVDGLLGDVYRGLTDFVLVTYTLNVLGFYEFEGIRQFGTEGEDEVLGAKLDSRGNVFVWGQTDGELFDGELSETVNRGGKDGFVYKFDVATRGVEWARFFGTVDDDKIVSLDASFRELIVTQQTGDSGGNALIRSLLQSGVANEDVADVEVSSPNPVEFKNLEYDSDARNYVLVANTEFSLVDQSASPTTTLDVSLLANGVNGGESKETFVASSGFDRAIDALLLNEDDLMAVVGETSGVFDGNSGKGGATDGFVQLGEIGEAESTILQFGTPGVDTVLDAELVSNRKFFVLWSEDYSSGDGGLTYRISPMSPEGEKLTADPL